MKVVSKQRNSKMCAICGMDNKYGLHAQFYNMEDSSVMTKFRYREEHQLSGKSTWWVNYCNA